MEHLSRQTTRDVDILFLISDPSLRGISTAVRMQELIHELRTTVGRVVLIVNRVNNGIPPVLQKAIADGRLELLDTLPDHPAVREFDAAGQPLSQLPAGDVLRQRVIELAQRAGLP